MPYQEPECEAEGGTCVDKCGCAGEFLHGFCPTQPDSIKCCKKEEITTEDPAGYEAEETTVAVTSPLNCPGGYNTNCNNGNCVVTCSGSGGSNNNNNGSG